MRKIYIFGVGKFFEKYKTKLQKEYQIEALIDNEVSLDKKIYYKESGWSLFHPSSIDWEKEISVMIMAKKCVEIFYQLMELGMDEKQVQLGIQVFKETEKEQVFFEFGNLISIDKKLFYQHNLGYKMLIMNQEDLERLENEIWREYQSKHDFFLYAIKNMPLEPVSRCFGADRGKPVDRYYVECFLEKNKSDIKGDVLEIADNEYSIKYGENRIEKSYILHVLGWGENAIKGNLETGEGIEENQYDAAIITQTLMCIYNLEEVAKNIKKMLKENGVALITASGIAQIARYDADNWGEYYSFYQDTMKKLFYPIFGETNVEIEVYGNVKTATALLYGVCCEELKEEDFLYKDKDYPVIIGARVQKKTL